MPEKRKAFVARTCSSCAGKGCDQCHGFGIRSLYEEAAPLPVRHESEWSTTFRRIRAKCHISFIELSQQTGLSPSRLSALENGYSQPSDDERAKIETALKFTLHLPPGSQAAIDAGCLCPVLDNGHGAGYAPGPDGPLFVYNEMCPIHGL